MIFKKNRLSEREVKKVLTRGKPFFSYGIVLNYLKNPLERNRFAVVIGGKSVNTNVSRNFFRRKFYDLVQERLEGNKGLDFVFVVKKQTKLDKDDEKSINSFRKDIKFLLNKIK
ncbi:MAG: ribonuclease P protein component [Candidatus Gracilibacteria bacterium]